LDTTAVARPEARIELPGSGTTSAEIEVVYQPRSTRVARSLIVLAVTAVVMPVVIFIPPHVVWPLVTLAAGLWLARRYWVGTYHVSRFEGECPRCGTALELKPGQRIGARHTMECYGCHRQPRLIIDEPGD
jgi:hypothetical protein